MTVLFCCVAFVAAITVLAPVLLTRGTWQVWHPRTALAIWHAALSSCAAVIVLSIVSAVVTAQSHRAHPDAAAALGLVLVLALWGGMFMLSAVIALFLAHSEPVVRSHAAQREKLQQALLSSRHSSEVRDGLVIRRIEDDALLACAFRAPEPTVVISRGLIERLTEAEVAAVIEHERAHLTQRHHFALLLALVNEACLPRFAPARRLHQNTKLLVELIADDTAIRRCGRSVTASALTTMARHTGDPGLAARARRAGTPQAGRGWSLSGLRRAALPARSA